MNEKPFSVAQLRYQFFLNKYFYDARNWHLCLKLNVVSCYRRIISIHIDVSCAIDEKLSRTSLIQRI